MAAALRALLLIDPVLPSPAFFAQVRAGRTRTAISPRARASGVRCSRAAPRRRIWAGRAVFAAWTPRALDLYVEFVSGSPGRQVEWRVRPIEATIFDQARHLDDGRWPSA